jgi:hypothetical protein
MVFLLINTVLMLNFVIAILSSTFNNYEKLKIGLYYNVLIELFAKMSWDDKFGCLICAQQPLNLLLTMFSPLMIIFSNNEEKLLKINEFICHILYFPFAIVITCIFTFLNLLTIPVSYAIHVLRLMTSIIQQGSFWKMFLRLLLTIHFAIYGIFYFPVVLVVDMFVFFGNLYTEATQDSLNDKKAMKFSREGLELFEEALNEIIHDLEKKKMAMIKNH